MMIGRETMAVVLGVVLHEEVVPAKEGLVVVEVEVVKVADRVRPATECLATVSPLPRVSTSTAILRKYRPIDVPLGETTTASAVPREDIDLPTKVRETHTFIR